MKRFLEQVQEDAMPRQEPRVDVLLVDLRMDVDELAQSTVVVDHLERAQIALPLSLCQRRLALSVTDARKEPLEILQTREADVLLHHLREGHRARERRQIPREDLHLHPLVAVHRPLHRAPILGRGTLGGHLRRLARRRHDVLLSRRESVRELRGVDTRGAYASGDGRSNGLGCSKALPSLLSLELNAC